MPVFIACIFFDPISPVWIDWIYIVKSIRYSSLVVSCDNAISEKFDDRYRIDLKRAPLESERNFRGNFCRQICHCERAAVAAKCMSTYVYWLFVCDVLAIYAPMYFPRENSRDWRRNVVGDLHVYACMRRYFARENSRDWHPNAVNNVIDVSGYQAFNETSYSILLCRNNNGTMLALN